MALQASTVDAFGVLSPHVDSSHKSGFPNGELLPLNLLVFVAPESGYMNCSIAMPRQLD